jgi:hypothetical protein
LPSRQRLWWQFFANFHRPNLHKYPDTHQFCFQKINTQLSNSCTIFGYKAPQKSRIHVICTVIHIRIYRYTTHSVILHYHED